MKSDAHLRTHPPLLDRVIGAPTTSLLRLQQGMSRAIVQLLDSQGEIEEIPLRCETAWLAPHPANKLIHGVKHTNGATPFIRHCFVAVWDFNRQQVVQSQKKGTCGLSYLLTYQHDGKARIGI